MATLMRRPTLCVTGTHPAPTSPRAPDAERLPPETTVRTPSTRPTPTSQAGMCSAVASSTPMLTATL
ncbi:hypothetical protein, partial [Enterococcus faecium]